MTNTRHVLTQLAADLGFTVRFTPVGPTPWIAWYDRWIASGHHGDMHYLERGRDTRSDPRTRLSTVRTTMVLAIQHHHRRPPDPGGRTGMVARYAWGRDYHNLVGKRLRKLRRRLDEAGIASWGGVDTAPILERAWASAAGMGFTGKNSVQIIPAKTSWVFLAVLFLDVDVEPDRAILRDHCGTCRRCLDVCPTNAFLRERELDARRCISYWTIESRGLAPADLRPGFGRWLFGCDLCQEVCPHNAGADEGEEQDLAPRHAWLDLDEILQTPDHKLMERFLGTPLRRPRAAGLKRNALVVLGNLRDPGGLPSLLLGAEHPEPVVRAAAVWALGQLGASCARYATDPSPLVQSELNSP